MKKIFWTVMASLLSTPSLFAAPAAGSGFANFDTAGSNASDVAVSGIKSWIWVIGFIPFAFGIYSAFKMNEYLNQKDESSGGQNEPKVSRYGKVLGAGLVGVMIVYLLLGLFGLVFAGKTFAQSWQALVINFWGQIF